MTLHPTVAAVTDRIRQRSAPTRSAYDVSAREHRQFLAILPNARFCCIN